LASLSGRQIALAIVFASQANEGSHAAAELAKMSPVSTRTPPLHRHCGVAGAIGITAGADANRARVDAAASSGFVIVMARQRYFTSFAASLESWSWYPCSCARFFRGVGPIQAGAHRPTRA